MTQNSGQCAVFRHAPYEPLSGYNPQYRHPEPTQVFTGTEQECQQWLEQTQRAHDYANPGAFDNPFPRHEIRRLDNTYSSSRPL